MTRAPVNASAVLLFALFLLALFVGLAFAAGYGLGRILL